MTILGDLVDERAARAYEETYECVVPENAAAAVPRAHRVCDDDDDELFLVRVARDARASGIFRLARDESEDAREVGTSTDGERRRLGEFSAKARARAYDARAGDDDVGEGALVRRGRAISGTLTLTRAIASGEEEGTTTRMTTETARGDEDGDGAARRAERKEKKREKEKKRGKERDRARGEDAENERESSRKRSRRS